MTSSPGDVNVDSDSYMETEPSGLEVGSEAGAEVNVDSSSGAEMKSTSNCVERVGLFASLDMTASFNRWFPSNRVKSEAGASTKTSHLLDEEENHSSHLFRNQDYMDLQSPLPLVNNLFNEEDFHPTILLLPDSNRPRSHSECWHRTESFSTEDGSTTSASDKDAPPLNVGRALRSRAYTADPTSTGGRLRRRFARTQEVLKGDCLNRHHRKEEEEDEHSLLLCPSTPATSTSVTAGQSPISTVDIWTDGTSSVAENSSEREALDERTPITVSSRSPHHHQMYSDASPLRTSELDDEGQTSSIIAPDEANDRERLARMRWININRRFQLVIAVAALVFSLLLAAILICWVALTVTIALSWDQDCDVPLKHYYWLVTLQLILDVFRTDIMRFICRWDNRSGERIPGRVVAYNCVYILYALLVLRLGVNSAIDPYESSMCHETAPRLFHASVAFVSLSIAAWITILVGYVIPFLIVAILLTVNGYNPYTAPSNSTQRNGASNTSFPVMPSAFANSGAPPGCVDQLRICSTDEWPSTECCICMEVFTAPDVVVETNCGHVFHKSCCREWLRQSRTCPVCRDDIPASLPKKSPWKRSSRRDTPPPESSPDSIHSTDRSSIPMDSWRQVWEATRNSWHDRSATSHTHDSSEHDEAVVSSSPQLEGTTIILDDDAAMDVEVGRLSWTASADLF